MDASAATTLLDAIVARDAQLGPPATAQSLSDETPAAAAGRFVLLSIADAFYAVPEAHVTELERVPRITMVPQVPSWMRGVTNVRGDIVSVIDMRCLLGLEPHQPPTARMLVVRLLDEPFSTGLIVDAVDRIVTVPEGAIAAPASPLEGPLAPFLTGVCEIAGRLAAVLDIDRLLRSSDIRQFDELTERHAGTATPPAQDTRGPSCAEP
jgi:purine-binding chemotaxis protein CheW